MSDNDRNYPKGMVWFGLVFVLAGGAIMLMSFSVEMADESTPRWVGFMAGLLFFNAGVTTGMMDSGFNDFREASWFAWIQGMALYSILLIFALLFNWVAFGPGEREFSVSISIPFLSVGFDRASEILGRIIFGLPALIMDFIIVGAFYQMLKEVFGKSIE